MTAPARDRDPALLDRLAADYLTGGMSPAAARRARRLMDESPEFRAAAARWRARLDAGLLDPQRIGAPSEAVWAGIESRIAAASAPPVPLQPSPRRAGGWGVQVWKRLTLGAGAMAVVAVVWAVVLAVRPAEPARSAKARMVATLQAKNGAAGAVLMVQADGRFTFTELEGVQPPPGRSFQLWLLPHRGVPISLGVAQAGRTQYTLPAAAQAALVQAKGFAVSVEPPGGSPTGQPTGPVVLVGDAHAA